MINYKSKYWKYKLKYLNTKLKLKGGMKKYVKNILIVCSYEDGIDFLRYIEDIEKFIRDILKFTNYTFHFIDKLNEGRSFPKNLDPENIYDLIWFAGCNQIEKILNIQYDKLLKYIFVKTRYIIFTEKGFNKHLKKKKMIEIDPKADTIQIENFNISIGNRNSPHTEYGINLINEFFKLAKFL